MFCRFATTLSDVDAHIQKNQEYKERIERLKKGHAGITHWKNLIEMKVKLKNTK